MSDMDLTKKTNFTQNQNTVSPKNLKDQVADVGAEMKQRAGDALRTSADVARDKFNEAANAAKDTASGTADHLADQARQKQRTGADFIERFADNIREAARSFENDAPFAARGMNSAADYVQDSAKKFRNGSFGDLVNGATDFAKRQPAAFLGVSVLAGFAVVRFFKASGGQSAPSSDMRGGISTPPRDEAWDQSSSGRDNSWERNSSSQRGNMS